MQENIFDWNVPVSVYFWKSAPNFNATLYKTKFVKYFIFLAIVNTEETLAN